MSLELAGNSSLKTFFLQGMGDWRLVGNCCNPLSHFQIVLRARVMAAIFRLNGTKPDDRDESMIFVSRVQSTGRKFRYEEWAWGQDDMWWS